MQDKKRNSTSVAWYKLADLIARGEREKALSVYRLLAHSLTNRAYALQLEGDILWSFDDPTAYEKYKQAAFLYKKEKRWIDAIAVCEHLLHNDPGNQELLSMLCHFYCVIDWQERFNRTFTKICMLLEQQGFDAELFHAMLNNLADFFAHNANSTTKEWFLNSITEHKHRLPAQHAAYAERLFF